MLTFGSLARSVRKQSLGRLWALATLSILTTPEVTRASPLFELIGSSLGSGGFNARGTGPSAASTYFNPALLPKANQGLEVGFLVVNDAIGISLDARSPDADVALSNFSTLRKQYPLPTAWLEQGCMKGPGSKCLTDIEPNPRQSQSSSGNTNAYQVIGFVGNLIKDRASLGFYAIVPYGALLSAHAFFVDEREQYFTNSLHPELYADRLTPMSLALGGGVQVTNWLSLGASFTLSLSNNANGATFVGDSSNLDATLLLSTKVNAAVGFAPHVSALIEPLDGLDISLTLHSPQMLEINADSGTFLGTGTKQVASRSNVNSWLPWTVGFGAVYDFISSQDHTLSIAATAAYKAWSGYIDRQGERPLPGYEWADTLSGALGLRYQHQRRLSGYLDVGYEPTPIPPQTGRTNYVGNDRYAATAGVTYSWPVESWGVSFRLGAQAQAHFLAERHQAKLNPTSTPNNGSLVRDEWDDNAVDIDGMPIAEAQGLQTNNPGWPGFGSRGTILGAVVSVGVLY